MSQAGRLDRRVVIERATTVANDLNEPIETWATLTTVWAERRDLSDGERFAGGQFGSSLMSRFRVRSSSVSRGIKPTDRLNHDSAIWNINGLKETAEGRRRFIEITATRDTDA